MVIGMGGVGSVIGQKLHEYDCFERILLADVDPTFAEHLREKTRSSRFQVCTVNAMDTAKLITLMREHEIAVTLNACPWQANHSVLEACHRAGSHYLDMAADIYSPPGLKRRQKTPSRPRSRNSTSRSWIKASPAFSAWAWTPER